MNKIDKEAIKNDNKILIAMALFTSLFLVIGVLEVIDIKTNYNQITSNSVRIVERKEDNNKYYYPVYSYEVDSEKYTCKGEGKTKIVDNKNKTIFYSKNDPTICSVESNSYKSAVTFIIFSIVMYLCVGIVIIRNNKTLKLKK